MLLKMMVLPVLLLLLLVLLLNVSLILTARIQNSTNVDIETLEWQPPLVNGQAIPLSSGGYIFLLSNYNLGAVNSSIMNDEPDRIVGGQIISIREAPWQILLRESGEAFCGGSIITQRWILTAAHCVFGGGVFSIRAGTTIRTRGGQVRDVQNVFIHPNFVSRTFQNDIALLKLATPLIFDQSVRPVRLASSGMKLPRKFTVSGWGFKREDGILSKRLRRVRVFPIDRQICRIQYAGSFRITRQMICAAAPRKDSCSGDSGGALVGGGRQYGIVSFGLGCARPGFAGVYNDVRKHRRFIARTINNNS